MSEHSPIDDSRSMETTSQASQDTRGIFRLRQTNGAFSRTFMANVMLFIPIKYGSKYKAGVLNDRCPENQTHLDSLPVSVLSMITFWYGRLKHAMFDRNYCENHKQIK